MIFKFDNSLHQPHMTSDSVLARQSENLAAIETHYPNIYEQIINHGDLKVTVNIDTQSGKADIIDETGSHYRGDAFQYTQMEIESFLQQCGPGCAISSMKPSYRGDYFFPRFFNKIADSLITQSPLKKEDGFQNYTIPEFYPHIVFMGCGLGLHIEYFLKQHTVHRVLILEPDLNLFIASLAVIDWQGIIQHRIDHHLPKISLFLGGKGNFDIQAAAIWNYLIGQCPVFPISTLYYIHRQKKEYEIICNNIDERLYVYLSGWGHYDDEINQLNQAFHNIHTQPDYITAPTHQFDNMPIAIVGSGPSLDQYSDTLKALSKTHIVFSCGSSITALYKLGIKPDIHVELESDYLITVGYLETIQDTDFYESIFMLGPIHLNPRIFDFFNHCGVFLKSSGGTFGLVNKHFPNQVEQIDHSTPTCVNLALSIALKYGASNVSLFGTDFGFKDLATHHAKESVYYYDDVHASFKEAIDFTQYDLFEIESVTGDKILTQPLYYAAKERVENAIQFYRSHSERSQIPFTVSNYSLGAKVNGTTWIKPTVHSREISDELRLPPLTNRSPTLFKQLLTDSDYHNNDDNKISNKNMPTVDTLRVLGLQELSKTTDLLIKHLNHFNPTMTEDRHCQQPVQYFDEFCIRFKSQFESTQSQSPSAYGLLKGAMWHFLHIGYSHLLGIYSLDQYDDKELCQFLMLWKQHLNQFLVNVNKHYQSVTYKDYSDKNDPWIERSINDPE